MKESVLTQAWLSCNISEDGEIDYAPTQND